MLKRAVRKQTPLSSSCSKCWDRAPMERYMDAILALNTETWISQTTTHVMKIWKKATSLKSIRSECWEYRDPRDREEISVDTASQKMTNDTRPNADYYRWHCWSLLQLYYMWLQQFHYTAKMACTLFQKLQAFICCNNNIHFSEKFLQDGLIPDCRDLLPFRYNNTDVQRWCCALGPGLQSTLHFLPKMLGGVEVRLFGASAPNWEIQSPTPLRALLCAGGVLSAEAGESLRQTPATKSEVYYGLKYLCMRSQ